jgi:hypothetical protein
MSGPRARAQLCSFGSRLGTLRVLPAQNGGPIGGPVLWQEHPRGGGRWAVGPLGRWPVGPLGRWAVGPLGRWAVGLIGPLGSLDRWAHWSLVVLACWCTGAHWEGVVAPTLVNELMSLLSTKTQNPKMGPTEPTVKSLLWFSSHCPLLRFFLPSVDLVPPVPAATMLRRSFMCVAVRKAPVLRVTLSTARGLPLRLTS